MKTQIIGIDVGRDKVKIVTDSNRLNFSSRVGEWRRMKLNSGGDYELQINQDKYFIGELAEESYFSRQMATESKITEETKVLFLGAIAIVADPRRKISINTGIPVKQHTKKIKAELTQLLTGTYKIGINKGEVNTFVIDDIGIIPESAGAYWDIVLNSEGNGQSLTDKIVRAIDIGSRTVNYCTIKSKKYLDRDSGTLPYGALEVANAHGGDELLESFARRIIADLSQRWLNYSNNDFVLLSGGGSLLLEKWFKPHFNNCKIAANPVMANASGFYKMGVARCKLREK